MRTLILSLAKSSAILWVVVVMAGGFLAPGCSKQNSGGGGPADFVVQVQVAAVKVQPVSETLSLVGSLVPDEQVEIKSETDGMVEAILFKEGQAVKQGDWLIRLDETKFTAAREEAQASFNLSRANLERLKQLLQSGSASKQEYDQAVAAYEMSQASLALKERQLKDARIRAPFDGVMGRRLVSPGQVIGKSALLGSLVAVNPLKAEFPVPERFLSEVQIGQNLAVRVAAWPGETFTGEVYFVAPQLDADTRTALAKARLPNPQNKLKPGMFASLDLTLKVRARAMVIPEAALMMREDEASVFVAGTNGIVQARPVEVGVRLSGLVEITQGLQDGENVIVEGLQKVRPGSKVQVAVEPGERTSTTPEEKGNGEAKP